MPPATGHHCHEPSTHHTPTCPRRKLGNLEVPEGWRQYTDRTSWTQWNALEQGEMTKRLNLHSPLANQGMIRVKYTLL
jgi:hypothetical protein